jgi:hypothetical protein
MSDLHCLKYIGPSMSSATASVKYLGIFNLKKLKLHAKIIFICHRRYRMMK